MRKQTPELEWHFSENDTEWERLQALLPPEITPAIRRRLQRNRYLGSVATILLLLAGMGGWWRYTTQAKLQADETELRAAVQQKPLALVTPAGDALLTPIRGEQRDADWWRQQAWAYSGLPAPVQTAIAESHDSGSEDYIREDGALPALVQIDDPTASLGVVMQSMELLGQQAIANVVLTDLGGKPAYRQTRFYQHTATGWLPTPPAATLWGAQRTLQTPYFVYYFRQRDAAVVRAAAPRIDAFYATLGRNFGLALSPTSEQLVIHVSVTQPPGEAVGWGKRDTPTLVPSPALYLAPADLTDADLLVQSLAFPLLDHVLAQTRRHHALDESWQPLLNGLSSWQMWDASLPVADWHEEVVRWLYIDLPDNRPAQLAGLPQHYAELCATYKLWMKSPVQVDIPLICYGQEGEERFWRTWSWRTPLTHLKQLAAFVPVSLDEPYVSDKHPGQAVALATLIEYAVATYGRERLPVLLAGLGDYASWETLLPAVYGISAAEFEAGWQAYLTTHYGVTEEHS